MNNKKAPKQLNICIPAFSTESRTDDIQENGLNKQTVHELLDVIKSTIDQLNRAGFELEKDFKNRITEKVFTNIEYFDCGHKKDPWLIIKFSAFSKNFHDGEFHSDTQAIKLKRENKIGTSNCYFAIYPIMKNANSLLERNFLIFFYEDPTKDDDFIGNCKSVIEKIIPLKLRNIKPKKALEEINSEVADDLIITFSSWEPSEEDELSSFNEYKIGKGKKITRQTVQCRNVPGNLIERFAESIHGFIGKNSRYSIKTTNNNKVINLDYERGETEKVKEAAMSMFNYKTECSHKDLESGNIFQKDYVESKIKAVISTFLRPQ